MLRIGRFTETESRLVVAKRWSGWGKMGSDSAFGGDKNVLKFIAQFCEFIKSQ